MHNTGTYIYRLLSSCFPRKLKFDALKNKTEKKKKILKGGRNQETLRKRIETTTLRRRKNPPT
jgi:hypothetical protein